MTASQLPKVRVRLVLAAVLLPVISLFHAPGRINSAEEHCHLETLQTLLTMAVPCALLLVAACLCTWKATLAHWRVHVVLSMSLAFAVIIWSDLLLEMSHW